MILYDEWHNRNKGGAAAVMKDDMVRDDMLCVEEHAVKFIADRQIAMLVDFVAERRCRLQLITCPLSLRQLRQVDAAYLS